MPTKTKQAINKNIPKLRFPGFSGEWEEKYLIDVSSEPKYGMNAASKKYDGNNIYLRITDIDEKTGLLKRDNLTSPEGELEATYRLHEGDLLFVRTGASVGKTYLYKETDGNLYFAGFLIKFGIEKANPYIIYLLTLQNNYRKWAKTVSMRSGQPGINAKEYEKFRFFLPSNPEQQKIANFLGVVDEWTNNLRRQKEELEAYKKGIMQKIFSQEIRFKDDNRNDFPEWQEERLGEVGDFLGGGTPSKNISKYWQGNIPWISSSDLSNNDFRANITRYITEEAVGESATKIIPKNSLLIVSRVGVGKFAIAEIDLCTSQDFTNFVPHEGINVLFIAYLLKSKTDELLGFNQGTSIKGFTKDDLVSLKIGLPHKKEQNRIADFFTSIDNLINSKQQQITQAEEWKRGLMQQLFI
jgi:type I restriction enzyme S subunit